MDSIDYMFASLLDMRLPRGRLLIRESGVEKEIPKRPQNAAAIEPSPLNIEPSPEPFD